MGGCSKYPAENQNGLSRDSDPVSGNLAQDLSTSAADLSGAQDRLAELFRPVGGQGALGGPGNRVLGNSLGRREESQHVIDVVIPAGARCRGADGETPHRFKFLHVWDEAAHHVRVVEDDDGVPGFENGRGTDAECLGKTGRLGDRHGRPAGEIQAEEVSVACHVKGAATGPEGDGSACRLQEIHQDEGCGQCGMSAKIHLDRGREPAQLELVLPWQKEGRLGEVVLGGDLLQQVVGKPFGERADGGWVPLEESVGERVDLVNGDDDGRVSLGYGGNGSIKCQFTSNWFVPSLFGLCPNEQLFRHPYWMR